MNGTTEVGSITLNGNEATPWTYTFTGLDKYDANGQVITYTITEDVLAGYNSVIDGYTVTNKELTEIPVVKVWTPGSTTKEVTIRLMNGTTEIGSITLNGNEATPWTYTFTGLDKYDANGQVILYTVEEAELEGYRSTMTVDATGKYIFLNEELTEVKVRKIWDDSCNQDGKRPANLVVTLSNGQTVTLNEANSWTATISGLPKYANGQVITYTWTEAELPEGYELTNTEVNGYVTTLTNTHTPETIEIDVIKVWDDDDNESEKRPKTISVTLYANSKEYETITLSEENNWKYTFKELPLYDDGEEIEYTIEENDIPEGYEVAYEGNSKEGFIIHNILGQGDGEPPEPSYDNPQTGDNILLYLITLIVGLVGFITVKLYLKQDI